MIGSLDSNVVLRCLVNDVPQQKALDLFIDVFGRYIEHPALSFEDCYLSVSAALENRAPLFTFDRDLASRLDEAELVP